MTRVLLASATGAPGVTTTALGLALTWPGDVLLADCDRDPAQMIQAGYLRGEDFEGRGLLPLSQVHREGRPLTQEVWLMSVPLSSEQRPDRRYLPGFIHPGSARLFTSVWPELGNAFNELNAVGTDIIIDAGRIGREGLPTALITNVDVVLVVVRSTLRSLAALRLYLPGLVEQIETLPGYASVGLLVVGENQPYSNAEISAQFGCSVWGSVTADSAAAMVLSDGEPEPRRFMDSSLLRSYRAAATRIVERVTEETEQRLGRKGKLA